jgi:hypothetical protein
MLIFVDGSRDDGFATTDRTSATSGTAGFRCPQAAAAGTGAAGGGCNGWRTRRSTRSR